MRMLGLLAASALVFAACSEDVAGPGGPGRITVTNNFFSPASTNPDAADSVIFTWSSGGVLHSVVWEDLTAGSGQIGTGVHVRDFSGEAPGTYRFRCDIHSTTFGSGMSGQIVVN